MNVFIYFFFVYIKEREVTIYIHYCLFYPLFTIDFFMFRFQMNSTDI